MLAAVLAVSHHADWLVSAAAAAVVLGPRLVRAEAVRGPRVVPFTGVATRRTLADLGDWLDQSHGRGGHGAARHRGCAVFGKTSTRTLGLAAIVAGLFTVTGQVPAAAEGATVVRTD